jgi:hypothetical protein
MNNFGVPSLTFSPGNSSDERAKQEREIDIYNTDGETRESKEKRSFAGLHERTACIIFINAKHRQQQQPK